MRKQIEDLREKMREKKIDAYIIPTTDSRLRICKRLF